jgi:4-oxalocrotonate tautomerase
MPHIQITMLEGRTHEQKRKLVERVTDAMVDECNANAEAVTIAIVEVTREDYARGGVLIADTEKKK